MRVPERLVVFPILSFNARAFPKQGCHQFTVRVPTAYGKGYTEGYREGSVDSSCRNEGLGCRV